MGMAHVPEGRRVFADLTVFENLKLGAYTRKDKTEIEETAQMIYKRFPRLLERRNQPAGTLSGRRTADAGHGTSTDVASGS